MRHAIIDEVKGTQARLRIGDIDAPASLGAAGIRREKQEGDHATPAGLLVLRRVLYRADRGAAPICSVPREALAPDDCWCDDPRHADYNTMVELPHSGHYERLWRDDPLYDIIGVLGWNDQPVVRDRGSAIFLHIAHRDGRPTEGCIATDRASLLKVLAEGLTAIEVPG